MACSARSERGRYLGNAEDGFKAVFALRADARVTGPFGLITDDGDEDRSSADDDSGGGGFGITEALRECLVTGFVSTGEGTFSLLLLGGTSTE